MSKGIAKQIASVTPRRVGLISLGCAKNLVDAELMLGSLLKGGVEITNEPELADALIVNTCSFIDAAQEESVDTILESAAYRDAQVRNQALIVSGCLSQRFREELPKLLPEVDAFMGIDQVEQVSRIVDEAIRHRAQRLEAEGLVPDISPTVKAPLKSIGKRKNSATVGRRDAITRQLDHDADQTHKDESGEVSKDSTGDLGSGSAVFEVNLRPKYVPNYEAPRFRLTPRHFAYVKIAEGCNHPCSFCTIPRMRGTHRSRPQQDIVSEARALIADGVKELNLISQDSTYYGMDLRPKASRAIASPERFQAATASLSADATTLATLIRELNGLPGRFWIRLLYTHPAHWTDDLIQTIAACKKVARYVDMPLQHIDDAMLERMRRETNGDYIRNVIAQIRAGIPGIAIRTTFIVGFPGEKERYFDNLLSFIRETQFERLGVFTYSKEDGTVAGKMSGQIPMAVRQSRRDRAMAEQLEVARRLGAAQVGKKMTVLVEGPATDAAQIRSWEHGYLRQENGSEEIDMAAREYSVARGEADAPDIDGRVYVRGRHRPGHWLTVRVVGHTDYDLIADPA